MTGRSGQPTLLGAPPSGFLLGISEHWAFRSLFGMLVWRILAVRYKQTVIGAAWGILQPLVLMLLFSIFFGLLTRVPSDGIAYPLFFYSGLIVWQFVSQAISQGAQAIVANGHIVTKVYFPRALLPAASVASALIDFLLGLPALVLLMVYYRSPIDLLGLAVFLLAFALVTLLCLGLALWFAAMWAFWRDVGYLLPFLLQLGMFASPIIYPISVVPPAWRAVYALNPFISAIGAARWAFAGGPAVPVELLAISAVTALVAGWGGYAYFRRRETFFSDKV